MAVNLTPQYLKAQESYRRAATAEEELRWLEVMYKELPKHKASEKVQSDLKTQISLAKKAVEGEKKTARVDKEQMIRPFPQRAGHARASSQVAIVFECLLHGVRDRLSPTSQTTGLR